MLYWELGSRPDWPVEVCPEYDAECERKYRLPCGCLKKEEPIDSLPIVKLGDDIPLSHSTKVVYSIAREDLLALLLPEVEEFYILADLVLKDQGVVPDRKALVPKDSDTCPWERGKRAFCYRCPICGKLKYLNPSEVKDCYLLRSQIPPVDVFKIRLGGLVISKRIYERLRGRRWPKMVITPLAVRDEPLDGFPVNLEDITEEDERIPARVMDDYWRHRQRYLQAMEEYEQMKRDGLV